MNRPSTPFVCLLVALLITGGAVASQQQGSSTTSPAENTVEAHLGRGYDAMKEDRYDVAASEFRAALELDPKLTLRARFPLAVALFELRKPGESRTEFEAVRREVGDHPNLAYYLGRLDLEERNFEAAVQNFSRAIENPPFPDTAYYLGFAYFKKNDLPAAEKWLKKAAEVTPRDARAPYQLGLVYHREGREAESKQAFALSQQLHGEDDKESRLRVECSQKLEHGPREEAQAFCDQLYDPNNAEKLLALGTIYGQHGDTEAALKPLQRAAELEPQSPQMQYNLALAYSQLNRFQEARNTLEPAVKRWHDLFPLNALYGVILAKLGEDRSAYEALSHAHELNPQDSRTADLLYETALTAAHKTQDARQYSDSLNFLDSAARLQPQNPEPHRRKAELYKLMGSASQARAEEEQANRLARDSEKLR